MTHVQISTESPSFAGDGAVYKVVVDGVDLSMAVLRDGFGVTFPEDGPARVTMVVAADVLDIDLPEAVVSAMREKQHPISEWVDQHANGGTVVGGDEDA